MINFYPLVSTMTHFKYSSDDLGVYWPHRVGLMLHISVGTAALLIGPFQLWSGFRKRFRRAHRLTGRVYSTVMALAFAPLLLWP